MYTHWDKAQEGRLQVEEMLEWQEVNHKQSFMQRQRFLTYLGAEIDGMET